MTYTRLHRKRSILLSGGLLSMLLLSILWLGNSFVKAEPTPPPGGNGALVLA